MEPGDLGGNDTVTFFSQIPIEIMPRHRNGFVMYL